MQNANYFLQNNLATVMNNLEIENFLYIVNNEIKYKDKIKSLQNNQIKKRGNQNIINIIKENIIH